MAQAEEQNIQIDEATNIRNKATSKFQDEEYRQARESMIQAVVTARETIETANKAQKHIDAAETFDPIAPFVTEMAQQLGSKSALERAKRAYEEGQYETALNEATTARDQQLQSRFIIDGGVVTAIAGGAAAKRYDALSRVSEFIADSTGDEDIEEL
jgi:gamma-glutamyl:cysteine ligase YbdK (ATP-grasp superfamily)